MQIEHAQRELKELLPWVNLRGARYRTLKIDRILPAQDGSGNMFRPDNAFVETVGNNIVAWPCKLTLAPNLGRQVLALLQQAGVKPEHAQPDALPLLYPATAQPAWETVFS
jgi:hypothetical protein